MNKQIVVVLAEGFEEIEAVAPIDFLRRLGIAVVVAGLNELDVFGAHGIRIEAECSLANIKPDEVSMLVLPGGMPGAKHLRDSDLLINLIRKVYHGGGYVAAICAAPIALDRAGIIDGKRVTAYPSVETMLEKAIYTGNTVEVDDRIITGKGPGAVFAFSEQLATACGKATEAREALALMFAK